MVKQFLAAGFSFCIFSTVLTLSAAAQHENPTYQQPRDPDNPIYESSSALNSFHSMMNTEITSGQMDKVADIRRASTTLKELGKISDWSYELENCMVALASYSLSIDELIKICSGSEGW